MDIISLNEYVFIERGYISLNELIRFLRMNIIFSCQNLIASNDFLDSKQVYHFPEARVLGNVGSEY